MPTSYLIDALEVTRFEQCGETLHPNFIHTWLATAAARSLAEAAFEDAAKKIERLALVLLEWRPGSDERGYRLEHGDHTGRCFAGGTPTTRPLRYAARPWFPGTVSRPFTVAPSMTILAVSGTSARPTQHNQGWRMDPPIAKRRQRVALVPAPEQTATV